MSLLRIINTYSKSATRLFQYNSDRLRILLLFLYVFLRSIKLRGVSEMIMISTTKYSDRIQ